MHAFADMFSVTEAAARPSMVLAGSIDVVLRRRLAILNIPQAASYDTRCFRRGHAEDIAHSDSGLREILAAGACSSERIREYPDVEKLEDAAVVVAHVPGELSSDSERWWHSFHGSIRCRVWLDGSFYSSLALGFDGVLSIQACVLLVATGPPGLPGRSSHALAHR